MLMIHFVDERPAWVTQNFNEDPGRIDKVNFNLRYSENVV